MHLKSYWATSKGEGAGLVGIGEVTLRSYAPGDIAVVLMAHSGLIYITERVFLISIKMVLRRLNY